MTRRRRKARRGSVRFRLIMPVAAVCLVAAFASWLAPQWLADRLIGERLHERAESMALTVGYAAESSLKKAGLVRLVNAMGADRDVNHIVAVAGTPPRVVASTRNAWIGLDAAELAAQGLAPGAAHALAARAGGSVKDEASHEVYTVVPIDAQASLSPLSGGAVLVVLDAESVDAQVLLWSRRIGGGLLAGALLVISAGLYLVHRVVLRPLDGMVLAIDEHRASPIPSSEELALVAESYNASLAHSELSRAALERAIRQVEAASEAKTAFLANMSHEIRTPMTAILGYIDILGDRLVDDPDEARSMMRAVRSNGDLLLTIINDILDVSKIEAGQLTVEQIATDPARAVADVAELMEPAARGRGIDVRVRHETPIPERIVSDPIRLRQIVNNLVGNAVKFTREGAVTIRLACDPDARELTIAVDDTGRGMSPEEVEAVSRFEPFNQGDSSLTRKFGGTGLGLCIASGLAERLGGGIRIESEAGRGSTFTVTVSTGDPSALKARDPLPASPGATGDDADPTQALRGALVLVAEDGPDNQRLIRFLLERAGADVVVCDNGRIAVDAIADGCAPRLVLMDMQMPELDGYAATRELRSRGFDAPIVALTAHAMEGDRERCLGAGCDDYLGKPISRDAFYAACARWLRDPGARAADPAA